MLLAVIALASDLQHISVVVENVPGGAQIYASRDGGEAIPLGDRGVGGLGVTFDAPPARMIQLKILMDTPGDRRVVYSGQEALADVHDDTLTFTYDPMLGVRRVAGAPSSAIPLLRDDDAALRVAFGWGALTLAWVTGMGVVWARRRG